MASIADLCLKSRLQHSVSQPSGQMPGHSRAARLQPSQQPPYPDPWHPIGILTLVPAGAEGSGADLVEDSQRDRLFWPCWEVTSAPGAEEPPSGATSREPVDSLLVELRDSSPWLRSVLTEQCVRTYCSWM